MIPQHRKRPVNPWVTLVFGVMVVIAGTVMGGQWALRWWKVRTAMAWPIVTAAVVSARMEVVQVDRKRHNSGHTMYAPQLTYTFALGEHQHYDGSTLCYSLYLFSTEAEAQAMLARHPKFSHLPVHYDPQRPHDNVVWPESSGAKVDFLIIGVILVVCGSILGIVSGLKLYFPGRQAERIGRVSI